VDGDLVLLVKVIFSDVIINN